MGRAGWAVAGTAFLAACQTSYAPPSYRPAPAGLVGGAMHGAHAGAINYSSPPSVSRGAPAAYVDPRPRAHAPLRLCDGALARNVGPVGRRGEVLSFTPSIMSDAGPLLRNPTDGACLSSGFGWRGAASGGSSNHQGLDLANANGGFIYAAGGGRIVEAGWKGSYGLYVEIDHGRGVRTAYGHFSELNPRLRPGVQVRAGEPIGRMGNTGNATGVHLHYELKVRGWNVDPLTYGPGR